MGMVERFWQREWRWVLIVGWSLVMFLVGMLVGGEVHR
jgi:hypothetical protein